MYISYTSIMSTSCQHNVALTHLTPWDAIFRTLKRNKRPATALSANVID